MAGVDAWVMHDVGRLSPIRINPGICNQVGVLSHSQHDCIRNGKEWFHVICSTVLWLCGTSHRVLGRNPCTLAGLDRNESTESHLAVFPRQPPCNRRHDDE